MKGALMVDEMVAWKAVMLVAPKVIRKAAKKVFLLVELKVDWLVVL